MWVLLPHTQSVYPGDAGERQTGRQLETGGGESPGSSGSIPAAAQYGPSNKPSNKRHATGCGWALRKGVVL